jgi:LysR family transcriptional regulator, benzoate and cis,cis-muconate-responsive activator of ben and cat genes
VETRRLEYFTALAEGGNFSRAAERLGISQPALSQQIQRLEEEVGANLFDRTARPVVLTEVGERLLARCADVLEHIRAIERLSAAASQGETGRLRIGVIPLALYGRIPQQIRAFRRRHPDVQVSLERYDTSPLIDLLEAGRLDVAFLNATVPGSALRSADLDAGPLVAVLPVDHPLARASSVRLLDLRAEPLVMFPRDVAAENFDLVITAFRAAGFSPKIITATGGYADQVGYVAAGVGYALLPREIECVRNDGVARVPVSDPGLTLTMRVSWRPTKRGGLLRTFLADLGVAGTA